MLGPRVRPRVEDGVAATRVGADRMLSARAVAQFHGYPVAGASAVGVVGGCGEKSAPEAMIHV